MAFMQEGTGNQHYLIQLEVFLVFNISEANYGCASNNMPHLNLALSLHC